MTDGTALTHTAPRITELTFANALIEGPHTFTGVEEIGAIWQTLTAGGVDPSFALGQFWVESLFGTAGWNIWSDPPLQSWGNILYPNSTVRGKAGVGEYSASNGYHYTYYPDWTTGVEDYVNTLNVYAGRGVVDTYGDLRTIDGATAFWTKKDPESVSHLNYLDIVLGRIARYDSRPAWEGEMAVMGPGLSVVSNQRYQVKGGERWYLKPGGATSYEFRVDANATYFGQVAGTSWGMIRVSTGRLSIDGKAKPVLVFVPNFQQSRVSTV